MRGPIYTVAQNVRAPVPFSSCVGRLTGRAAGRAHDLRARHRHRAGGVAPVHARQVDGAPIRAFASVLSSRVACTHAFAFASSILGARCRSSIGRYA